MGNNIVIGGYYGFDSTGDDAMLEIMTESLIHLSPDCNITVLCACPQKMKSKYNAVCVSRMDFVSVCKIMRKADLYISGGGSLLQDSTSKRSLYYYSFMIRLAKAFGAKVYIYANGIGPLSHPNIAARVLNLADRITVRDPVSLSLLRCMGISPEKACLTADPVFLKKPSGNADVNKALAGLGLAGKDFFTVSLRRCKGHRAVDEAKLYSALSALTAKGLTPLFISMQDIYDLEPCRKAAANLGGVVLSGMDASLLSGIQARAALAVGMRLHFLLLAVVAGTPAVSLSYDCKVDNTMMYLGEKYTFDAFSFDSKSLSEALLQAAVENGSMRKERIMRASSLSKLALSDAEAAVELAAVNINSIMDENFRCEQTLFRKRLRRNSK